MKDQAPSTAEVADTKLELQAPRLAPGVELVGEQIDAGFQDTQWLVQRDGRFLQVSELLYRTLERLDGRRSLASVAAGLTETTRWTVTAQDVRQLIERKLVPNGLVAWRGDAPTRARTAPHARSPLAVHARRTVIGPRGLDVVTRMLQHLYSPPVLAAMLTVIALTHVWLYVTHGVGPAIREVTLQPALILAATLIFVASAALHELGHASALRYAGGRARRTGVGVYLVYPVFFTDTTDAYRLGRWARVRVDLGGFYFQFLVATVLMGVASATGDEWLLLPVLMIDLEALRQLLFPFVRLDGYWLFADLTGVPDFFSQAGPFVRSMLPGTMRKGTALPPLKRSTKAVFLGYLTATIPVLGFLTFQLVTHVPGFFATAWRSFSSLGGALAHALSSGDIAQAASSLAQLLILALPAIGSAVLSLVLSAWLGSTLWRTRRLAGQRARVSHAAASASPTRH